MSDQKSHEDPLAKFLEISRGAIYSPVVVTPTYLPDLDFMREHIGVSSGVDAGIYVVMCESCERLTGVSLKLTDVRAESEVAKGKAVGEDDEGGNDDMDLEAFKVALETEENIVDRWLMKLSLSQCTKDLKPANISNFFASTGNIKVNGKPFVNLIKYAAIVLKAYLEEPALRQNLTNDQFTVYHTTSASSGQLCKKAVTYMGAEAHHFFSQSEVAAIDAAYTEPWNMRAARLIPQRALVHTYAILEANGNRPADWYQGNRAHQEYSAPMYNVALKIAKQYVKLMSRSDAIDGSKDIKELFSECGDDNLVAPLNEVIDNSIKKQELSAQVDKALSKRFKEVLSASISDAMVKIKVNSILGDESPFVADGEGDHNVDV